MFFDRSKGFYRSVILALSGLALLGATPPPSKEVEKQNITSNERTGKSPATIAWLAKVKQPSAYEAPCKSQEANRNSDLCAQWVAANAARDAADWAYYSLIIGLVGAIGIVAALGLTLHSNWIARSTAKHQLRAYCSIESAIGVNIGPQREPGFELVIVNSGQTPAFKLKIDTECLILGANELPKLITPIVEGHTPVTIGNGGTQISKPSLGRALTNTEWQKLVDKDVVLWLVAYGEYYDIFDQRQTFRITAALRALPASVELRPAAQGNYFT